MNVAMYFLVQPSSTSLSVPKRLLQIIDEVIIDSLSA